MTTIASLSAQPSLRDVPASMMGIYKDAAPISNEPEVVAAREAAQARIAKEVEKSRAAYSQQAAQKTTSLPLDASKATTSSVVIAQSVDTAPKASEISDTRVTGSPQSENVVQATATARSARIAIETVNFGSSVYNGAKKTLEDAELLTDIRNTYGDDKADMFIRATRRLLEFGLSEMGHGQALMQSEFKITGTVLSKTEQNTYHPGKYILDAGGNGWSVSVKSTGEALATANGVDVSDQISDNSSTGFKWSDVIAARKAAETPSVVDAKAAEAEQALKTMQSSRQDYLLRLFNTKAPEKSPQNEARQKVDIAA